MAKIDFDRVLIWTDGTPIPLTKRDPDALEDPPATTLKDPVMQVLLSPLSEDNSTPGRAYRLYQLIEAVKGGGEVELDAPDVALIRDRIEKMQTPWIVGQCFDALEGREKPLRLNDPAGGTAPLAAPRR